MGWLSWHRLLLLIRQRNALLGDQATANTLSRGDVFEVDVTLHITSNVPWRWLVTGTLL